MHALYKPELYRNQAFFVFGFALQPLGMVLLRASAVAGEGEGEDGREEIEGGAGEASLWLSFFLSLLSHSLVCLCECHISSMSRCVCRKVVCVCSVRACATCVNACAYVRVLFFKFLLLCVCVCV